MACYSGVLHAVAALLQMISGPCRCSHPGTSCALNSTQNVTLHGGHVLLLPPDWLQITRWRGSGINQRPGSFAEGSLAVFSSEGNDPTLQTQQSTNKQTECVCPAGWAAAIILLQLSIRADHSQHSSSRFRDLSVPELHWCSASCLPLEDGSCSNQTTTITLL